MEKLNWRVKLASLWIIQVGALASSIFIVLVLGKVNEAESPEKLAAQIVFFFFIPCLMIWCSMILKNSVLRWSSFVLGILFTLVKLILLIENIAGHESILAINHVWHLIASALIIWYSWKMPKQEDEV